MKIARVNIYGTIGKTTENQPFVDLQSVKNQLESQKPFDEIDQRIDSNGGYVVVAQEIINYLNSYGKPIKSTIENKCFSVATVIHTNSPLERRFAVRGAKAMIHTPMNSPKNATAEELRIHADNLDHISNKMVEEYVEKTNLSREEAIQAMKIETTYMGDELIERGFVTKIVDEMKAVALFNVEKLNHKQMTPETLTKAEATKNFNKLESLLKSALKAVSFKGTEKALMLLDVNGTEIEFSELQKSDQPKEGDKAVIDGAAATGEYIVENGNTLVFEAGELKQIKEAEPLDAVALKNENKELKAKVRELESKNDVLNQKVEETKESILGIQAEFTNLKKISKSTFSYTPELNKDGHEFVTKKPTRKLFKE